MHKPTDERMIKRIREVQLSTFSIQITLYWGVVAFCNIYLYFYDSNWLFTPSFWVALPCMVILILLPFYQLLPCAVDEEEAILRLRGRIDIERLRVKHLFLTQKLQELKSLKGELSPAEIEKYQEIEVELNLLANRP